MDSRCEILIEKIYRELEEGLAGYEVVLEDLDDYFYEYERDELQDILEDISLNYLNRKKKWEKKIVEETLGEGGYEEVSEDLEKAAAGSQTKEGVSVDSYGQEGYDTEGYDVLGWSREGYHKTTQTKYNRDGYDRDGYNELNWSKKEIHKISQTEYDEDGYDIEGYNTLGWSRKGIHKESQSSFDKDGYNIKGYDILGWNKEDYNEKTGSLYNEEGYDRAGNKRTILQKLKSQFLSAKK